MPLYNVDLIEEVRVVIRNVMVEADSEEEAQESAIELYVSAGREACLNGESDISGDMVEGRRAIGVELATAEDVAKWAKTESASPRR